MYKRVVAERGTLEEIINRSVLMEIWNGAALCVKDKRPLQFVLSKLTSKESVQDQ